MPSSPTPTARETAVRAIIQTAADFPDIAAGDLPLINLPPDEARLAVAIHRTTLQRWITLETVINLFSRQPLAELEPALQAILLTASAQLLFMDRLPAYAVVNESVALARKLIRPGAAAMVNAILRKIADLPSQRTDQPWTPAPDHLPIPTGTLILTRPILPEPANFVDHLAIAASHPRHLIQRWLHRFGETQTAQICLHALQNPPTIVAVEPDFHTTESSPLYEPHQQPGFIIWRGDHPALVDFLAGHLARRVQDPAAALAVQTAAQYVPHPATILDLCAGRGTKTRQLAATYPQAKITATDVDSRRLATLKRVAAPWPNVLVIPPHTLKSQRFDLILLDVPCSNTGVLARRPEARYRFNDAHLASLVTLQQQIMARALTLLSPRGHILYATCSLEPEEDEQQTQYLASSGQLQITQAHQQSPAGQTSTHHDGSYHALLFSPAWRL